MTKRTEQIAKTHIITLYDLVEKDEKELFLKNLDLSTIIYDIIYTNKSYAIDYIKILFNAIEKWLKKEERNEKY